MTTITQNKPSLSITWEKLPDHYILPNDPVDNLIQPLLAEVLREILEIAGLITPTTLIATNFGLCATVNGKIVVKAPDWVYVSQVQPLPPHKNRRSYTPHREGNVPAIVMEFLSDTDGGEYSLNPRYPYGKMWFYERILHVPIYAIFEPEIGELEVYFLISEHYQQQIPNEQGYYWLESLGLFLGVWEGTKAETTGYWLRWWNREENLLPLGVERVEQERQRAEQERQRAEQERQRAELAEQELKKLRELR